MSKEEAIGIFMFAAIAAISFGMWQSSPFAGIFAGVATLALWRKV